MAKHVPGPWHRNIKPATRYPVIFSGRNKHVCALSVQGMTESEAEATLMLIQAAPDMLAALRAVTAELRQLHAHHYRDCTGDCPTHAVLHLADAAIAKAEG